MIKLRLGLVLFFILMQTVVKIWSENILLQGRYHFNHPPSVEDYNPVPIIVNYNEGPEEKSKATIDLNNYDSETETISQTSEELLPPGPSTPTEMLSTTDTVRGNAEYLKPKGRTLNEQQIPVTVIYENDDQKVKSKLAGQNQNVRKVQTNRQQKQLLLTEKESQTYAQDAKYKGFQTASGVVPAQTHKRSRQRDPVVPILESENFLFSHRGDYRYGYESGDGTKAFGRGELKTFSDNSTGEAVEGSFSYKDKEGNNYSLTYTADENGFRPVGDHLPTPPPLPPAIARALRYLATKKPESVTEKF